MRDFRRIGDTLVLERDDEGVTFNLTDDDTGVACSVRIPLIAFREVNLPLGWPKGFLVTLFAQDGTRVTIKAFTAARARVIVTREASVGMTLVDARALARALD